MLPVSTASTHACSFQRSVGRAAVSYSGAINHCSSLALGMAAYEKPVVVDVKEARRNETTTIHTTTAADCTCADSIAVARKKLAGLASPLHRHRTLVTAVVHKTITVTVCTDFFYKKNDQEVNSAAAKNSNWRLATSHRFQ